MQVSQLSLKIGIGRIGEHENGGVPWDHLPQQLQPLCAQLHVHRDGARDIAAGVAEASYEAQLDGITAGREDNGN